MSYTSVSTPNAPSALGPYTQALKTDSLVFLSGSIPIDPKTMKKQALKNMTAVAEAAGVGLANIVKTTVYLKDMGDFSKVNAVYGEHFGEFRPARTCVEVARLPLDVLVEVEAIAAIPK